MSEQWVVREVLFDEDGIPLAHREPSEEAVAFMYDWENEDGYSATSIQIGSKPYEPDCSGIVISNIKPLYIAPTKHDLLVKELLEALEDVSEFLNFAWNDIEMDEYSFNLLEDVICKAQQAIAKAKGE